MSDLPVQVLNILCVILIKALVPIFLIFQMNMLNLTFNVSDSKSVDMI